MRLKSIVLDGFKSYAHRQELGDLDPHFNAITGLNGSGKSNIFDAICFVMGISNLKKVRAEDPSELIFKNGHAGIQRASVTIEFVNDDPRTAPDAYPCHQFPTISISRQILVGGRQKFFFNGKASDQTKVKHFFHSVSLNVDNPHFLVLQGTVHKLVNMRPSEILGWLEEAAGTRVFDARRRTAENMIVGREKKVAQLSATLDTDLGPMLRAMQQEQQEYETYMRMVGGLEEKRRFSIAHSFFRSERTATDERAAEQKLLAGVASAKEVLEAHPAQMAQLEMELQRIGGDRGRPEQGLQDVRDELTRSKRERAAATKEAQAADAQRVQLQKELQAALAQAGREREALRSFVANTGAKREALEAKQQELEAIEASVPRLKQSLRLLQSGLAVGDKGLSLEDERAEVSAALIALQGKEAHTASRRTKGEHAIAVARHDIEADAAAHVRLQDALNKARAAAAASSAALAPHQESRARVEGLQRELGRAEDEARRARDALSAGQGGLPGPLEYSDVPGHDLRRAIHGRLGELVEADEQHQLPLTVGAGAMLHRVVIRSDEDADVLMTRANLRRRTGFLPLNKVTVTNKVTDARLQAAQDIARRFNDRVWYAPDLVRAPAELGTVVEFAFAFLVCETLECAKALANDRVVSLRAVTLDGDQAQPSGVMSGGAAGRIDNVLRRYAEQRALLRPFHDARGKAAALQAELREAEAAAREATDATMRAEADTADVRRLEDRLQRGATCDAKARLDAATADVVRCAAELEELAAHRGALEGQRAEIDRRMAEAPDTDARRQELERDLLRAQRAVQEMGKEVRQHEAELGQITENETTLKERIHDVEEDAAAKQREVEAAERDSASAREDLGRRTDVEQELQAKERALQGELVALDKERARLEEEREQLEEERKAAKRQLADGETALKLAGRHAEEARQKMRSLLQHHPWIAAEQSRFGDPTGPFYFHDQQRTEATLAELRAHEDASRALENKVNKKATVLYDQCRADFEDLVKQRETLLGDKETILQSIQQVEAKKWESLDEMVDKVSRSFSELFSACLPHAACKLVEERNASRQLTGLAVKVAFNGKEKESLSELSGGQRSLLALCLILAILRFRPAPVYILDEVDAALDPSHTQNIGKMLAEHFADAQFLLVSLKDGMFNSANCVYEIRNTQGFSEVGRRARHA